MPNHPPAQRVPGDAEEADCILKHIALAEVTGPAAATRIGEVRGLARVIASCDDDIMRARLTRAIHEIVAAQFRHVIDPQAGGPEKQAELNKIHGPPKIGGVARC